MTLSNRAPTPISKLDKPRPSVPPWLEPKGACTPQEIMPRIALASCMAPWLRLSEWSKKWSASGAEWCALRSPFDHFSPGFVPVDGFNPRARGLPHRALCAET